MKKEFNFLGNVYDCEACFAEALKNNYGDALNYIFTDEFISSFTDPYLKGRILVELRRAKYVESALAMILYLLDPSLGLVVRGKSFRDLNELAVYMQNDDEYHETIKHLFLDHAITHTLGLREDITDLTREKLIDIEDNIEDPAIYRLFSYLYNVNYQNSEYHGLSRFDYYFYCVKNSKDPFRSYNEVLYNVGFKADLLKESSINEVLSFYKNDNLPFLIYRDLLGHLKLDISEVLTTGLHIWLAKNRKAYKAKNIGKKALKQMKKCYKKSLKPQDVEKEIKLAEKMYRYSLLFIEAYDLGLVLAKKEGYELVLGNGARTTDKYNQEIGLYEELSEVLPVELDKDAKKIRLALLKNKFKEIKKN